MEGHKPALLSCRLSGFFNARHSPTNPRPDNPLLAALRAGVIPIASTEYIGAAIMYNPPAPWPSRRRGAKSRGYTQASALPCQCGPLPSEPFDCGAYLVCTRSQGQSLDVAEAMGYKTGHPLIDRPSRRRSPRGQRMAKVGPQFVAGPGRWLGAVATYPLELSAAPLP